ncbi:MAG TPA: ferrous iron transport protein A [Aquificales bacterium]|nr:ferrous iron transport protein A [Aquificales bacterium]HIO41404.1 ferrous iron transport protein A [Aquifex sp.]
MGVKPLSEVPEGKRVKVVGCSAGRMLKSRLAGLGITAGQTLTVLQNRWGPLLVEVMGRKIGIGRGQAEKILVEELE